MTRVKDKLTSAKGRKFSCNREDWCTYDNFLNMNKCIYQGMVEAGITEKLDVPVFMDANGNAVDVEEASGRKCTHKLVHPEMIFLFLMKPTATRARKATGMLAVVSIAVDREQNQKSGRLSRTIILLP